MATNLIEQRFIFKRDKMRWLMHQTDYVGAAFFRRRLRFRSFSAGFISRSKANAATGRIFSAFR
ncbi:MAG: hypothetical protein HC846_07410 [Blastocatellia bacterium]|nr:hypothetical protein [Blastocatellia bacterium]